MQDEYLSCDIIEYGFDVQTRAIDFCCRVSGDSMNKIFHLISPYNGEKIDWDNFFSKKQKIRDLHKNGEIFKPCSGCLYLRKEKWDGGNYIRTININNWVKCNADCIYCDRPELMKHIKSYNILPVFKDMIKRKILISGGPITISGGEPTIIREFEPLLNLLLKNNMYNIKVLTNAIKYSKAVEKGLKTGAVNILVSTDSGTRDTYKKVKRTDKHNNVWKNIKKYVEKAKSSELVKAKFILIPGINANKEELIEYIKQSFASGLKHIEIDVEIGWFYNHRQSKTNFDYLYDLYSFASNMAKEMGIYLEPKDRMLLLLQDLGKNV